MRALHLNPETFDCIKDALGTHIRHWGYVASKEEFLKILGEADVALSTARLVAVGIFSMMSESPCIA